MFSFFPGPPDNHNHKVDPTTFVHHSAYLDVRFCEKAYYHFIYAVGRTIVNGLCYLATFIFGINSIGLFLYSGQLDINSFMGDSANEENKSKGDEQLDSPNSTVESATDTTEVSSSKGDQSSNDTQ